MKKSDMMKYLTIAPLSLILIIWIYFNNKELSPQAYFWENFIKYEIDDVNFAGEKMPVDWKYFMNVQKYDKFFLVTAYQTYQIMLYKKRANLYFPYIEEQLKKRWLPEDIKYIAVAESWLINDANSHVWASWIWQFMPATAERFGLIVNKDVDERYNFEKATDASLDYFEFLYNKFWDWTLAAAAYNRWEWGISKALANQWVKSFYDLELNSETSNYIFRILAIKYTLKGLEWINTESQFWEDFNLPKYTEYYVHEIEDLKIWAKERELSIKEIKDLNPWIIGNKIPYNEENWVIKVAK